MVGCDHSYDVPINFMPDKTGTTISVPLGDTIERKMNRLAMPAR